MVAESPLCRVVPADRNLVAPLHLTRLIPPLLHVLGEVERGRGYRLGFCHFFPLLFELVRVFRLAHRLDPPFASNGNRFWAAVLLSIRVGVRSLPIRVVII